MVKTPIELIGRGGIVAQAPIVIGRTYKAWHRVTTHDGERGAIEAAGRDGVGWKSVAQIAEVGAARGRRIINGGGEYAAPFAQGRHGAGAGDARFEARSLPVGKKERPVLGDRATEHEPILVAPKSWTRPTNSE